MAKYKKKGPKKQKVRTDRKATHELVDGEVSKVDLVTAPATGDLWLAARSKDAAQEIIEKGEWAMARKGMAAVEFERNYDASEDDDLTVEVSEDETGSDDEEIVTRIGGDSSDDEADQQTIDADASGEESLTRADVKAMIVEGISETVPDLLAQTLRQLGFSAEEDPAAAAAEPTPAAAQEPVARAGAKMNTKRLKRFSGAVDQIEQGISTLGQIHRELGGGEEKKVSRALTVPVQVDGGDLAGKVIEQMRGLTTPIVNKLDELARDVKKVNGRVDKMQGVIAKPSTKPVDKTDEVKRGKKKDDEKVNIWRDVVNGSRRPSTRK